MIYTTNSAGLPAICMSKEERSILDSILYKDYYTEGKEGKKLVKDFKDHLKIMMDKSFKKSYTKSELEYITNFDKIQIEYKDGYFYFSFSDQIAGLLLKGAFDEGNPFSSSIDSEFEEVSADMCLALERALSIKLNAEI